METDEPAKEPESIGQAAARLLARLNERAKKASGRLKGPEQIADPGKAAGAAIERAPASWRPGGRLLKANGQDMANGVPSRCEGLTANDNARHVLILDESAVPQDRAKDTLQGIGE